MEGNGQAFELKKVGSAFLKCIFKAKKVKEITLFLIFLNSHMRPTHEIKITKKFIHGLLTTYSQEHLKHHLSIFPRAFETVIFAKFWVRQSVFN